MNKFISVVLLLLPLLVAAAALYSMNTSNEVSSPIVVTEIEPPKQPSAQENTAVSRAESAPVSGTSFTNAYGTATTKCAKSGCSNYIASSGDTNCCTAHSNKCLECGKYIDGDAMYCMSCIESSVTGSSSGSSFTNDYGTSSTKCARSGCSNPIASSGDTNCCTAHSNKCLECGKYIDGDAMYCMSCLSSSLTGSSSSSSYSGSSYSSSYDSYDSYDYSSSASDPYGYGMPEAGESFSDYVQRVDPQLYSDMEDIFNSMY